MDQEAKGSKEGGKKEGAAKRGARRNGRKELSQEFGSLGSQMIVRLSVERVPPGSWLFQSPISLMRLDTNLPALAFESATEL
jgi:hypothetical protein